MYFAVNPPATVLVFAGADPTSGAGLQADLLTLTSLGCHALTVVTALTAQDTHGVQALKVVEPGWVRQQARAVLADIAVAAFKIGMVGSAANAVAIARIVAEYPTIPVVLDPVLASGRGDSLASEATRAALCEHLLPRASLITPNSIEARTLAGLADNASLADVARRLIDLGARNVLITGTHEPDADVCNTLYAIEGVIRADHWPRLPGSYHGSGCTLASAIAATLAQGLDLAEAVHAAQEYTWHCLERALAIGRGQALPDRFFWLRQSHPSGSSTDPVSASEPGFVNPLALAESVVGQ